MFFSNCIRTELFIQFQAGHQKHSSPASSDDGNCGNFQRDNCCKIRNQRRNYPAENKIATSSSATKNKRASCVGFSTIIFKFL